MNSIPGDNKGVYMKRQIDTLLTNLLSTQETNTSGYMYPVMTSGTGFRPFYVDTSNTLVYIPSSSSLGIGTSPLYNLDVSGNVRISNRLDIGDISGLSNNVTIKTVNTRIGVNAGQINQNLNAIAIGVNAGLSNQNNNAIAIGVNAGLSGEGINAIAIGNSAGYFTQGANSIAIGNSAGYTQQDVSAVAIGFNAGYSSQKANSIAIGPSAGYCNQGANSIAIGAYAGQTNQHTNSIIINAIGTVVTSDNSNSLFIAPIRLNTGGSNALCYNPSNKEVTYSTSKTFVINHPIDNTKYLQHACLEGPEAGVYYRGEGKITNNEFVEINLPNYADKIATEFTVHITSIYDGINKIYNATRVNNNSFKVYGVNGEFTWIAYGKRLSINAEPSKDEYTLHGDGPYTYLVKK